MSSNTYRIDLSTTIYILLIVLIFSIGSCYGQEFINKDNFKEKIAKDIVAIEFWAGWNESNQFNELNKLKDCNTYRIDITSCMTSKMNIMYLLSQLLLYLIMVSKNADLNLI